MQNERWPPEDSREWLNRARGNLVRAKAVIPGSFYEDLCFDAAQAAEKSLKAILLALGQWAPRTHNMTKLLVLIEEAGVDIPPTVRSVTMLTTIAVLSRYPSHEEAATAQEHQEALAIAETVLAWATNLISE